MWMITPTTRVSISAARIENDSVTGTTQASYILILAIYTSLVPGFPDFAKRNGRRLKWFYRHLLVNPLISDKR